MRIGSDPELMLRRKGKHCFLPAYNWDMHLGIGVDGDSFLGELRPYPGELEEAIANCKGLIYRTVRLAEEAGIDVYAGPFIDSRSLGGHLHFEKNGNMQWYGKIHAMDFLLSRPLEMLYPADWIDERKKDYGKDGSVRENAITIEYRTPYSWIARPELVDFAYTIGYAIFYGDIVLYPEWYNYEDGIVEELTDIYKEIGCFNESIEKVLNSIQAGDMLVTPDGEYVTYQPINNYWLESKYESKGMWDEALPYSEEAIGNRCYECGEADAEIEFNGDLICQVCFDNKPKCFCCQEFGEFESISVDVDGRVLRETVCNTCLQILQKCSNCRYTYTYHQTLCSNCTQVRCEICGEDFVTINRRDSYRSNYLYGRYVCLPCRRKHQMVFCNNCRSFVEELTPVMYEYSEYGKELCSDCIELNGIDEWQRCLVCDCLVDTVPECNKPICYNCKYGGENVY